MKESIATYINETLNSISIKYLFRKEKIKESCKRWIEKNKEELISIGIFLIVSLCVFGYSLVTTNFKIPLSGDGYIQEQNFPYKFYDDWHEFFRTGHFPNWDTSSAIGTNNIGGNSFYSLLSPFMLPLLIFPRNWIQVELGLKFFLQTTLACYFFYHYLKEFNLSIWTRRVGGITYGFCGCILYFIWFEHFLDSFVMLPLIFWGVEKVIRKRDPRLLLASLFLQGMTNYFFLVIFCFGGAMYSLFRYFTMWKKMGNAKTRINVIIIGVFAFIFGILASGIVLLPGIYNAKAMPRVSTSSYLDDLLYIYKNGTTTELLKYLTLFDKDFQNLYPLNGFIFAPTHSYSNNLVGPNYYDNLSGSSFIYTPMLLLTFSGVLYGFKKFKPSYMIGSILVGLIIFCPFFYYMFAGFTVGYARFLIVPSSWMIVFASIQLEEKDKLNRLELTISFIILITLQALATWLSYKMILKNPTYFDSVDEKWLRFILVPLEMAYAVIVYIVLMTQFKKSKFNLKVMGFVIFEAVAVGNVVLYYQGFGNDNELEVSSRGEDILTRETNIVSALEDYDDSMYRIQNPTVTRWNTNTHMKVGHNGLSAFNSNYAFESQDFLDWSRIPYTYHNWSMGEHNRRINVEEFLGVKYYLVAKNDLNVPFGFTNVMNKDSDSITDESEKEALKNLQLTIQKNYDNDTEQNTVSRELYVNDDYVNFAFAFDNISSSSKYSSAYYADYNEFGYLRTGIVESDIFDQVKYLANKAGINISNATGGAMTNFNSTNLYFSILSEDNSTANIRLEFQALNTDYDVTATKTKDESGYDVYSLDGYDVKFTKQGSNRLLLSGFGVSNKVGTLQTDGSYRFTSFSIINKPSLSTIIYPSSWDGTKIIPGETPYDMNSLTTDERKGMNQSTKVVLTSSIEGQSIASNASEDNPVYISLYTTNEWVWHFYDENGEEIYLAGDRSYSSDYQNAYGFYVRKPISKIEGYLKWTVAESELVVVPALYLQDYSMYKLAINKLNEEPIEMISSSSDRYDFKTNYSSSKYVVLNNPLMNGWKLQKVTDDGLKDVTVYKSQGGFVGFIDYGGENEYILSYSSPGIDLGFKASIVGLFGMTLMSALYIIYYYNSEIKRFHTFGIKETFDDRSAR